MLFAANMQHLLQHVSFCVSQDSAADAAYKSEIKNVPVRCLMHVRAYSAQPHVCIACTVRNGKVLVQTEELETFLSEWHRNIDSCIFVTTAKKSKSRAKTVVRMRSESSAILHIKIQLPVFWFSLAHFLEVPFWPLMHLQCALNFRFGTRTFSRCGMCETWWGR